VYLQALLNTAVTPFTSWHHTASNWQAQHGHLAHHHQQHDALQLAANLHAAMILLPAGVDRWDVTAGRPSCQTSFEGHIDWVNDLLLYQDRLVTCSSDKTVKIWQTDGEGASPAAELQSSLQSCLVRQQPGDLAVAVQDLPAHST
jgi:WD40 repeat protein